MSKIIDLSVTIDEAFWEPQPVQRKIVSHQQGADLLGKSYLHFKVKGWFKKWLGARFLSKRYFINYQDFPDEMGLSLMTYTLTTHTGTHLDAPYHYGWKQGAPAPKTITDIPLEWCYADGVLLDFSAQAGRIDAQAVKEKLQQTQQHVKPGDIVLFNTGAFQKLGTLPYFTEYRGIERSALAFLAECGVKIMGTDAFSFDPPFCQMIDEYKATGDKRVLWPAHFYGREQEYLQIERLGFLEEIPTDTRFKVCCFPIKLKDADAAWSRVVAIVS